MRITLVAVGKVREPGLRTVLDEYLKRIGRYARVEEVELRDTSEADLVPKVERALPERSRVIALEVHGRSMASEDLARLVGDAEMEGVFGLAFVIGGSHGLPAALSKRADLALSLSPMTLPHRLARVVLAEQIYRAFTILRGEPYSH